MELEPNTLLRDRYLIQHQLGKGGMGAVYAAHDTVLDTQVALKINQNPHPEGRDQFLSEARLLAALRHPNLPRVIDYFLIEDSQYLVMDYVPGEDLGSLIKQEGSQPLQTVLNWAGQLGNALTYLHQQNPPVIHRDIKPANIKLTPSGNVMLVDFGIAKAVESSQETSTGARGMTPGYSPPEQYGTARTGPYSDQFSLASTIYNLLTGQKPVDAVERMLGQAVLTPLNLLLPNIPPQVQSAIEKAMSVRPEERFSSVQEFIQTLTQPLPEITQQPDRDVTRVAAPPPPPSDTSTRVGVPYTSPPPIPQKKRPMWWLIPVILIPLLVILIGGGWFVMNRLLTPPTPTPASVADIPLTEIPAALPTETTLPTFAEQPTEIPTEIPTDLPTNTPEPTLEPTPEPTATPAVVLEPIGRGGVVAFTSNEGDGSTFQIWSMRVFLDESQNLIAAEKQQLTNTAGDKFYPAWSPDGGRIVYAADSGDEENQFDLYVMDANGENQTVLVAQPGDDTEPAWSPDGNWIVFTSDSRSDGILQLHIVKPDGSELHRISFDKQEFSPEWSPRMDKLVYIVTVNNARYLWIRDPQDNFADTETNLMYGRLGYFADPAWSPDAQWLAFTREEGRTRDIYLTKISSFGMEISRLTDTTFDSYPAWSSDSQWLLFDSNRDGNQEIYIMNRDGGQQTNLTQTDNVQELQPAWQIK
ncbi:MAG: hypothetical protein CL609_09660 [Anaerolineaceae bacterium]|nr:hypothetical protein [Anaerolineaceae bacterium]